MSWQKFISIFSGEDGATCNVRHNRLCGVMQQLDECVCVSISCKYVCVCLRGVYPCVWEGMYMSGRGWLHTMKVCHHWSAALARGTGTSPPAVCGCVSLRAPVWGWIQPGARWPTVNRKPLINLGEGTPSSEREGVRQVCINIWCDGIIFVRSAGLLYIVPTCQLKATRGRCRDRDRDRDREEMGGRAAGLKRWRDKLPTCWHWWRNIILIFFSPHTFLFS